MKLARVMVLFLAAWATAAANAADIAHGNTLYELARAHGRSWPKTAISVAQ